jgi:hypothetical protein
MSYNISTTNNTSAALNTALANLTNLQTTPFPAAYANGSSGGGTYFTTKLNPAFKMELYKSENEGFILNLISFNLASLTEEGKLFILKDIENLGRDIQNILMTEIIKK